MYIYSKFLVTLWFHDVNWNSYTRFYKQHFHKQNQAEIGKK